MRKEYIPLETVLEKKANNDDFTLIEVLGEDQYEERHIPGAVSMPVNEIGKRVTDELEKDEDIVVYCASYVCQASVKATDKLLDLGFKNVKDFKGGKARWQQAGLEFESGEGSPVKHEDSEQAEKEHEDTCEFC